ncbi:MAG: response regulator [Acidobacteriota bacterium]
MKVPPFRILLVEDNQDHAELVMRSLEDHPMPNTVHHLSDGEAALDYLFRRGSFADEGQSPRPHIILLDLRLPKIDGLDVLKELRTAKELDEIPVIILSTSSADADVGKAYSNHANSYLVKPNDFQTFDDLMKALGFYWLGWNHFPGPPLRALAVDGSHRDRLGART